LEVIVSVVMGNPVEAESNAILHYLSFSANGAFMIAC
jgi:hypothetical protein